MRILSCNIYSFGSLCDYKADFKEGLSSITEQNGFGKTTLSVFIKAMFYSMKPARKTDTHLTRERVKYYPWNGGSFGGSLDFEQNGKAYRIIRRFDKFSATQDEFSLIDLSTNSECNDFSENIGEEIFGVDVDGFLRSTFSNGESTLNEMPASVRTKISSNLDIADDFDGYESAQLKISEALKALNGRGKEIDKTRLNIQSAKTECERLSREISGYETLRERAKLVSQKNEQIKKEISVLDEKIDAIKSKEASKIKIETYNELVKRSKEIEQKIIDFTAYFGGKLPQNEDIDALLNLEEERKNNEILLASARVKQESTDYKTLLKAFENGIPEDSEMAQASENIRALSLCLEKFSELENLIKDAENEKSRSSVILNGEYTDAQLNSFRLAGARMQNTPAYNGAKANYTPVFIISAIVLLIGVGLCFVNLIIGVVIAALGVVGLIAGALLSSVKKMLSGGADNKNTADGDAVKEFLISCGFSPDAEINSAVDRVKAAQEIALSIKQNTEKLETEKQKAQALKSEILNFLKGYVEVNGEDFSSALEGLKNSVNRYNNEVIPAIESVDNLRKQKERIQKEIAAAFEKIGVGEICDASEIKERFSEIKRLESELEENKIKAKEYYEQNKIADIKAPEAAESLEELSYNKEALDRERVKIEEELAALRQNMLSLSNAKSAKSEQEEFIEAESEKLKEYQRKAQILAKTQELLLASKNELSQKYAASLNSAFKKYSSIFFENTDDFSINHQMDLSVVKEGLNRDASCFSQGQQAVMDVCLRLSLIDTMFEKERPALVLDDPFYAMDEKNFKSAAALLKEVSKNTQIIYLTCHKSREI